MTEDTLTIRDAKLPDYVELGTLNEGDVFETDSSSGTVSWVIRNGHAKGVAVIFQGCKSEVSIAPSLRVRVRSRKPIPEPEPEPLPPDPIPTIENPMPEPAVAAAPKPPIRIVQIIVPQIETQQAASQSGLRACDFKTVLTQAQIDILRFKSATDLFCTGLHSGWTKQTFYDVCRSKFPGLKCGRDYEACMRQVNLYRATLRKAGKLG